MDNRFADKPAPSSAWIWQAGTGVALLVLLAIHMIAQHFVVDTEGGLRSHADVVAYIGNPVVFVIEAAFLVVVTIHALLGVRAIVFDFGLSARAEARVTRALQVLGAATVAYGIWLLVAVA
jgi:succinate dehydrogenase hydrophobic anchor subunit